MKDRTVRFADAAAGGQYEREDWTLFRSVRTISQLSGVPPELLRRLVAKELADNGLDVSRACRVGELPHGGFYVEDDGPGIGGEPEDIARLFSFRRPLVSSKLKRLPTRGALGNGLRIVAGAVYASGGKLRVLTRDLALDLAPRESGETLARVKRRKPRTGTRVEVWLGDAIPEDEDFLVWAESAITAAGPAPIYEGKTSPWWHDSDSFFELLKAAGQRTVGDVLQEFDGELANTLADGNRRLLGRTAASLTYEDAEEVLGLARSACEPVRPQRLALLKKHLAGSYAKALGRLILEPGRGTLGAELPYTVEVWCDRPQDGRDSVTVLVNRTPVTADVCVQRSEGPAEVAVFGCNLHHKFTVGRKPVGLVINVQTPYMPITSTGKEPDLVPFLGDILETVEAAAKSCQRANRPDGDSAGGLLPSQPRGRPSDEKRAEYEAHLERFAERLKEIDSTLEFKVSARGWCYILENEHGLSKGDFDKAERIITECRKNGLLPVDFTVEDEARSADNLEECDDPSPAAHAASLAAELGKWADYVPASFWDFQPVYVEMLVEKVDLKSLFLPVCEEYHVPIMNSRGWSDLNQRAAMMRRFQEHERKGRRPVLLACNDHDPVGVQIPTLLPKHFEELAAAVGWSQDNLIVERFGLNFDFIEANNLTWIDGLKTSSGKDLGYPKHPQHNHAFVQDYIARFGKRKVEANALVVRPEAGRQLCREAIEKHLDLGAIAAYERALAEKRALLRAVLPGAVGEFLGRIRRGE
jgi:hypothetical protein